VIQGAAYLINRNNPPLEIWLIGLLLALGGASLLIGLLTPAASVLVGLVTLSTSLSWFPPPVPNLLNTPLPAALLVIISVAVALLGPGALSIDCRLFGRREIIIPQALRLPKS